MDYPGFMYPLPEMPAQYLTGSLDDGLVHDPRFALEDLAAFYPALADAADVTHAGSTVQRSIDYDGFVVRSWPDDLFEHILVIPARLDLGNILSAQSRTVELANLYFEPRDWEAITNNAGGGIEFPNLPALPRSIPSFSSFVLQVTISVGGPPSINGSILFEFDVVDVVLPITGQRVVIYHPHPQGPVEEELEWLTDSIEAHDGTEQAISLREAPRQRFTYRAHLVGNQATYLRALLFDWLPRVWGVPIWFEQRRTTAAALAAATEIDVPTSFADFRVGELALVYTSADTFDVLEVAAIAADSLEFQSGLANAYPSGTLVMPVRTAYARAVPDLQQYPVTLDELTMTFECIVNVYLGSTAGATIYDGRVVLDDPNIIDQTLPISVARPVVVIDNGTGQLFQSSRTEYSKTAARKAWYVRSPADIWRVRQLVHAFRGSQRTFWLPTFRDDLRLAETVGASATSIKVEWTGYTQYVRSRRPFGDIRVTLTNGTQYLRRILSAELDGAGELLSLNAALSGSSITAAEVRRIEFLQLARIADDRVEIRHEFVGEADIVTSVITVAN